MNGRTLHVLLAILGLSLPLVSLSYFVLSSLSPQRAPARHRPIVPMLSDEKRLRLKTHAQACKTDEDCEAPLSCFYNMRTQRRYCSDSTCSTDKDCEEDFTCRLLRSSKGEALLRTCALEGLRQEGEMCNELPALRIEGCAKGLLCNGFCGRPCRLEQSTSCPDGYTCKDGDNGPSCQPMCEGRPCPLGERCTSLFGGLGSTCMRVYGQDCGTTPCATGLQCRQATSPRTPGKVWMECLSLCAQNEPRCPDGQACSLFQCRPACSPEGPSTCSPGFSCLRNHPGQPWACMPSASAP